MIIQPLIVIFLNIAAAQYCQGLQEITNIQTGQILSQDEGLDTYQNTQECQWKIRSDNQNDLIKVNNINIRYPYYLSTQNAHSISYTFMMDQTKAHHALLDYAAIEIQLWGSLMYLFQRPIQSICHLHRMAWASLVDSGYNTMLFLLMHCARALPTASMAIAQIASAYAIQGMPGVSAKKVSLLNNLEQNLDSLFTPREMHALAYDSVNDLAYMTFGYSWIESAKVHNDMLIYNFRILV